MPERRSTPTSRSARRRTPPAPGVAPSARGARRKRETRQKLLTAALRLMAERGMNGVAINEITEAADVGFGSFYNHFESKEEIHAALVEEVLSRFGEALSRIAESVEDPAEILAASIRYAARRAREDPIWGRFLLRNAFSIADVTRGVGPYFLMDLRRGIDSGRFAVDDLLVSILSVAGTTASAIAVEVELGLSGTERLSAQLDLPVEELPERAAGAALEILGIPRAEAEEIARRPLPRVDLPAGPI